MTDVVKFRWNALHDVSAKIMEAAGVPSDRADLVAQSLVQANLRGVDSHGVIRIPIYVRRIMNGMVNPIARPEISTSSDSIATVDGNNTLGVVAGKAALDEAKKMAAKTGVGIVGVRNSNHFGTGAYYALDALRDDLILIAMSNASQTVPPTGGVRPFLGTNPLTVGIPAAEELPFVLDMATSVVARGKIIVAAEKGERIPEGWAIDKDGRPTTDAEAALLGSVLPFGGYKGYAISLLIDMLAGVLTGAGFGRYINNMYENWSDPQNVGHLFIALNIAHFLPVDLFKKRVDQYIRELKAEPKAPSVSEILIPGEIEFRLSETRKREGIELPSAVVQELSDLAGKSGLRFMEAAL